MDKPRISRWPRWRWLALAASLAAAVVLATTLTLKLRDSDNDDPPAGLSKIDHVVVFMQENRSWNTYFGTMAGARGFQDPNVQLNDGLPVWLQPYEDAYILPFHLAAANWSQAVQCMSAGSNGYRANQAALNHGLNNHWARNNTPWSWGYLRRPDLPVQFAIADAWTVADMYQQSQITATNPNRVMLVSGSINAPGSPQHPDQGGVYLDNNNTPGCEAPGVNCYPLRWRTVFELYEAAGVSWRVYQGEDNFDDNPLVWFEQYQNARPGSPLADKGIAYPGLDRFYQDAAAGTLPQVSFIVGPRELSEHAPYSPKDGGWLQQKIVDAVTKSPKYDRTALLISYDESGGWGDHVPPYHSPKGTPGEWIDDYMGIFGDVSTGPGFRVPFYIVSPWTRGGRVFTEHADHTSHILFIEQWLSARGVHNITTPELVPWRRAHMSNLVNAFDFDNPDLSLPQLPKADLPHRDSDGNWDGSAHCESLFPDTRPPVPIASQAASSSLPQTSPPTPRRTSSPTPLPPSPPSPQTQTQTTATSAPAGILHYYNKQLHLRHRHPAPPPQTRDPPYLLV
ncbi:conserved hypothetical protein [Uncinocarpus reesii 1704]|uniref:Phospholipase C n=1 Tax=Uncinocarpus reesii (strain UAMH 1704) TaxID=336963 RepID=C4JDR8_UNCRE|nr:uncharacterized protein UREG_00545 [Uncinocarpus reesii 1704]EEP75698.1 conserved hypothetical protein [Uncinocarpus reesii 1704]